MTLRRACFLIPVCVRRMHACYAALAPCNGGKTVALAAEPVNISLLGYTGNMRCKWVLTGVPPIELEFISFATELHNDFVTVYRGSGTDFLLGKFSGADLPARLKVRASAMTIIFTSDSRTHKDGFVAVLKAAGGCAPAVVSVQQLAVSPLVGAIVCPHGHVPPP
jgi:hypothetical protein